MGAAITNIVHGFRTRRPRGSQHPIDIISDPKYQAAKADYVVCRRVSGWPDVTGSRRAVCCACPEEIWISPNSPAEPKKICDECWATLLARQPGERPNYLATSRAWGESMKARIDALVHWRRTRSLTRQHDDV